MVRQRKHNQHFFKKPVAIISLLVLVLLGGLSSAVFAQQDPLFIVSGVEVDETAEDAAKAREKAFASGQFTAFGSLTRRLLTPYEQDVLEQPEAEQLAAMVRDFEVQQERLSSTRYTATLTFRFDSKVVKDFLAQQGIQASPVVSAPVLIIPVYQTGSQTMLWETANLWHQEWMKYSDSGQTLVPVTVPLGDIADLKEIPDQSSILEDVENVQNMARRYGVERVVVAVASIAGDQAEAMRVFLYRLDHGRFVKDETLTINASDPDVYQRLGVAAVTDYLQQAWKVEAQDSTGDINTIRVNVVFGRVQDWVHIQKELRTIQTILNTDVIALSARKAELNIEFRGGEERLRRALAQRNMALSKVTDIYAHPYAPQTYSLILQHDTETN